MSEKLIIENRSKLDMWECLEYAKAIVATGRISETAGRKQYCFHTRFKGDTCTLRPSSTPRATES